MFSTCWQFESR